MTEVSGTVVKVEGVPPHAYVEVGPRASGCGRCHEPGGCGGGLSFGPTSSHGKRIYRLPNHAGALTGDKVSLIMQDGALIKVSLLTYLFPLLLSMLGAILGAGISEPFAVAGAGVGLVLGFALLRYAQRIFLLAGEPLVRMKINRCEFK